MRVCLEPVDHDLREAAHAARSRARGRPRTCRAGTRRRRRPRARPRRARASKCQRYGGKSHDQPTTSPGVERLDREPRRAPGRRSRAPRGRGGRGRRCRPGRPRGRGSSPASKPTFDAQPAISSSCSGSRPAKTGLSRDEVVKRLHCPPPRRRPDRGELLGDVDADRAPRDAAAAADAAGACRTGRARCRTCA